MKTNCKCLCHTNPKLKWLEPLCRCRVLIAATALLFLAGCGAAPGSQKPIYRESQFNSRLEYLRLWQRYHLYTGRCG
jgi:hypothetical protein